MKKIIDTFIFYNELDMLLFRLEELYDTVDFFVIVEATKTFVGNAKELFFEKNKHKYQKYMNKIIHIVVDDMPCTGNAWDNEYHQRKCIDRGISKLDLSDDDLIIISDCDEIPDVNTLEKIKNNPHRNIYEYWLKMDLYFFNIETKNIIRKWYRSKLLTYRAYKGNNRDCEYIRMKSKPSRLTRLLNKHERSKVLSKGGWHFSYFGDVDFIKNKINNFSHQECNSNFLNDPWIMKRILIGGNLYTRGKRKKTIFKKVDIKNNGYLPKNYKMLL